MWEAIFTMTFGKKKKRKIKFLLGKKINLFLPTFMPLFYYLRGLVSM